MRRSSRSNDTLDRSTRSGRPPRPLRTADATDAALPGASAYGVWIVDCTGALALSNKSLATLDYHVDPEAPRATMLEDADFARLGVKVDRKSVV